MFVSNIAHTNRQTIRLVVALTVLLSLLLSTADGSLRAAPAYTEVGGPIISDTTWTLANSPYIVVANVEVWQGVTVATVNILAHVYDWYDDSARGRLLYIPYSQDPDPNAPVPPPQNLQAAFAGGSAGLSWDAIPSTTTGYGYKVYYDTDTAGPPYHGTGAAQGDSPVDVGNAIRFTLSGLGSGVHVAVTAYDTQGRESWYSNEGSSPRRIYLPAVLKR